MIPDLTGKVVVLTGASRGIGTAIARRLATDGARLVLAARDEDGLRKVAAAVGAAKIVPCDVTVPADRERLIREASEVGPIDVLVNTAGIEIPVSVVDHRPEDVDRELAVNLLAPIHLTKAVLPSMIARGTGVIAMMSSMSGKSPTPYNAVYTASKHGLNGFTASLRLELLGTGVHAGVICPGFVADAGMWADTGVAAPAAMREVPIDRVVDGVVRVIRGAAEVLVTPTPMRPLLAIGQLFPTLDGPILTRLGVMRVLRERATATAASRRE
ncbi:MAG: SDR family NAD(P)-dependent oxidoreductase [Myxococcota bacterium]